MKIALLFSLVFCAVVQAAPAPPKRVDVLEPLPPSAVKIGGFLGQRFDNNAKNRLLVVDENELLAGFRNRPGKQAWIGEHVGKFLHAATLTWANNRDAKLREKIDRVASELIKTQEADGYLGTYTKDKRFGLYPGADWDVWVHKYNLLGLLAHYEYTHSEASLNACRKIGDLLCDTFGPGKKSINAAGTHVGMAATSVLEPMVLLYRATADEKYLSFAKYLVAAWDEPNGAKIIKTLTETGKVNKTANGKAYEMLSNLVGLCELARQTGDAKYLEAPKKAWANIVENQRYITGTASHHEHFHADHELPNGNSANLGETCVTTTWIQLNWQLLRLTGEAKYGDEIERAYYNHLAGAQLPDGSKWCYYTPLEGAKPYGNSTNCCLSSGPRAMALLPQMVLFKQRDKNGQESLYLNLWESCEARFLWKGREEKIFLTDEGNPPTSTSIKWESGAKSLDEFLLARLPQNMIIRDKTKVDYVMPAPGEAQTVFWKFKTNKIETLTWRYENSLNYFDVANPKRDSLQYGPYILAYDEKLNPDLPRATQVTLAEYAVAKPRGDGTFEALIAFKDGSSKNATFVPFAQAGATGGRFAVWLRKPGNFAEDTLGVESRSREGNVAGSIADGEAGTYVVTFDGSKQTEDWFAVALEKPMNIKRVVYAHGKSFHDGGWFDASAGKPKIQVRKTKDGAWETVGELTEYPATTSIDNHGLKDGQQFTLQLPEAMTVFAVRVVGKPSSGDDARQAFSSCAELSVFEK